MHLKNKFHLWVLPRQEVDCKNETSSINLLPKKGGSVYGSAYAKKYLGSTVYLWNEERARFIAFSRLLALLMLLHSHPFNLAAILKLTERSRAVILLRKRIRNGKLSLSENAKTVWESDPVFMSHKLDSFRTRFNKIRAEEEKKKGKWH